MGGGEQLGDRTNSNGGGKEFLFFIQIEVKMRYHVWW